MFWWFERGGAYLRYEVFQRGDKVYELRIIQPDGSDRTETFTDLRDLTRRQAELERDLQANGWTGPHGRNL